MKYDHIYLNYTELYRIKIIASSGSGKANALINLINEQNDIENLFVCKRFE